VLRSLSGRCAEVRTDLDLLAQECAPRNSRPGGRHLTRQLQNASAPATTNAICKPNIGWANGEYDRLPTELLTARVEMVVTAGPPAAHAFKQTPLAVTGTPSPASTSRVHIFKAPR
jgi:hypothetical protein